jgi:hypothetical protein
MNALRLKLKSMKSKKITHGDVVALVMEEPFEKGKTLWGTVVEVIDRGGSGKTLLCGVIWFNKKPSTRDTVSYHYEYELLTVEEKLTYDDEMSRGRRFKGIR